MKTSRILFAFLILTAISSVLPPTKAQAGSRVYVGVDLGNLFVPVYSGPRYVYSPPVVYERWPAWQPAPYPYPPPRWRHHPPPPPPRYGRHHHGHHRDHRWNEYRR